ncbi:MAG: iron donor protein CyaY [Candidatus Berkiella sp.]
MNEQQYHDTVDDLFLAIEHWLEKASAELDFETQQNILTITLPQGEALIFSKQAFLQEVWLATPLGAYHFHLATHWQTKQGQSLIHVLAQSIEQIAHIVLDPTTFGEE